MNFKKLLMIALFSFGLVNSVLAEKALIALDTDPNIAFNILEGYKYYEKKNYEQAFPLLKKGAENGNMLSQSLLGKMYHNGWGVTENVKKAAYWYQKSAEQGDSLSALLLGGIYFTGEMGGKKDFKKAFYWFQKVDGELKKEAQYILGVMYMNGFGVKEDHKKARQYLKLACDNGQQKACDLLR